ncbi:unnamed protein product, partial [Oppiella nova]
MELTQLSRVRHKNIVHLYATAKNEASIWLVMELAEGILHKTEPPVLYSLSEAISWVHQCASGVAYLHSMRPKLIVHRDLKSANLLLFHNRSLLKIGDFGESCDLHTIMTKEKSRLGTVRWMAPEVMTSDTYTEKCDVYSWAMILWEVLARQLPYGWLDASELCVMYAVVFTDKRPSLLHNCPQVIEKLMIKCWTRDPAMRLPMKQVEIIMSQIYHDFKISNGTFGGTHRGIWNGREVALKQICIKDKTQARNLFDMPDIENIIKVFGTTKSNGLLYLVVEYADGVLHSSKSPEPYTMTQAISWIQQCLHGVQYLHSKDVIIKHLKSTNLMLFNQRNLLKICDYIQLSHTTESARWMAPEVFTGNKYTEKCDVYSWGTIFWEVLARQVPYDWFTRDLINATVHAQELAIMVAVVAGERPSLLYNLSTYFDFVIESTWERDPIDRPTINMLEHMLENHLVDIPFEVYNNSYIGFNIGLKLLSYNQNYRQIGSPINRGKGSFGTINKGYWKGQTVSVDITKSITVKNIKTEIELLSRINHQNIIRLLATAQDPDNIWLITEYADGGNLYDFLHMGASVAQYSMFQAIQWVYQCARGVAYLHNMKPTPVLHRDLKSFNRTKLKICGFGSARERQSDMTMNLGTPIWMAPEVFRCSSYNEKCDVYSWGIILWEVLARGLPFKFADSVEQIHWAVHSNKRPPLLSECPQVIEELMIRCWANDPDVRPSMTDVESRLKSRYVQCLTTANTVPIMVSMSKSDNTLITKSIDTSEVLLKERIDKGSFGTVYKAIWRDRKVAVKLINREQEHDFDIEEAQLSRLNHKNIVKLLATGRDKDNLWLVMEFAEDGSLYKVVHKSNPQVSYSVSQALQWLHQCARGVAYLHSRLPRAIIHRDLNSKNLLLFNRLTGLKICDFRNAREMTTNDMTQNVVHGTPRWMAPEVFRSTRYNERCDVYSWGIILWEVLARELPFHFADSVEQIQWAVHSKRRPPLLSECPQVIEELMIKCWANEPSVRPSMADVESR